MIFSEIRRFYLIIRVILNYGLDECIPKTQRTLPIRLGRTLLFWIPNNHGDRILGERLRLALQDLGPVWIKLGQMLSTRRDLFSKTISDQLVMLQDKVQPFDGSLARIHIERSMEQPLESWFDDFQQNPLASASIAQVHAARLKNGKEVVIKVIRPDVLPMIQADMRLMYLLARWIPRLLPACRRLRPVTVLLEYKKTLLNELNLLREAANAIQLRRNFVNSPMLYIPEIYTDYCSETMMVMERIYGVPVSDVAALEQQGTNMQLLAERGVQVFFTQIFRDGFFHGDMHPGNIFVSFEHPDNPYYIGIDYGIVGSLNKEDQRYLAENLLAFLNRNYRKVAELHVDSGWVPMDTDVADFEFAIRTVCEPIFEKPLAQISFGHLLLNLFNTARRFNMEVQPQLVLLQKTLLYIEGVGRQLYPQLDLWTTAKPFLEHWLREQVSLPAILRRLKEKTPYWAEKLPELPELVYDSFKQHRLLRQSIDHMSEDMRIHYVRQSQSRFLFGVGTTLLLSGTFLTSQSTHGGSLATWLMTAGIISWMIGLRRTA
ncbi:ubiquinone biosynthesis regulatory protein kinase UbiB [secondary endosymbiont of Ctenarytaina eucalypti]|uniref:Probable protein kinase UbiB n=1 Tax=secondary endosymbiont of Ctenarytaina eucalypti TaxID=1199245 RepID=J3Z4L0_9ENTR|nr:ubiquinone biosynthesis regulatory protein kinase UbiB [secondary endosymbiont of Ctenarytaina eucalypti]AFP85234.1 2-octaprenylphenol hydroxylase [secondary endosymbiont of Ctenarytaina eucalypti]